VGILTLAIGSWLSLHRPLPSSLPLPFVAPSPAPAPSPESPLPPAPDPAISELPAWPHLNPDASIVKAWRVAEGPHRAPGDRRRLVTLTFDDGPFPETTPRVLELLERHNVHATFFVVGRYLDGNDARAQASRDVLKQIVAAGHLVGNHTHDHELLASVSHTRALEQIDEGAASIERVIGKKPTLFRPPFGALDEFGEAAARERGLDVVLWSAEVRDMERSDRPAMFRDLVHQLAQNQGGVVLLHDIRFSSISVLRRLLSYLEARRYDPAEPDRDGYEVVDLPTYLRAVEAAPPHIRPRKQDATRGLHEGLPPLPKSAGDES
jgi:peptidoglycan/xylan/chitin deacetylase (PgdA/CDA1 family)